MIYVSSKPERKDSFREENVLSMNNLRYTIVRIKNNCCAY